MLGGVSEMAIGLGVSYFSSGFAAPLAMINILHGADQIATGFNTIISNRHQKTLTTGLLQQVGFSENTATALDMGMGLTGTFASGAYALRMGSSVQNASYSLVSQERTGLTSKYLNELSFRSKSQKTIGICQSHTGKGFSGKKGWELKNALLQPLRNSTKKINGRVYVGHALDQMQNRGITPMVVEETIARGICSQNKKIGRLQYYDPKNNVSVVTEGNSIITTCFGEL